MVDCSCLCPPNVASTTQQWHTLVLRPYCIPPAYCVLRTANHSELLTYCLTCLPACLLAASRPLHLPLCLPLHLALPLLCLAVGSALPSHTLPESLFFLLDIPALPPTVFTLSSDPSSCPQPALPWLAIWNLDLPLTTNEYPPPSRTRQRRRVPPPPPLGAVSSM